MAARVVAPTVGLANMRDYSGRNESGWHIDKTVNVSHILTTVAAIAAAATMFSRQDTRLTVVEVQQIAQVAAQQARDVGQDARSNELKAEVNKRLDDIASDVKQLLIQRGR